MGVNAPLNRKLRMGLVGGGQGAFIGRVHATAAILDNRGRARRRRPLVRPGQGQGLRPRLRHQARAGLRLLSGDDRGRIEAAGRSGSTSSPSPRPTTRTSRSPRRSPRPASTSCATSRMTFDLAQAEELAKVVQKTGVVFAVTHNYTGYPAGPPGPRHGPGRRTGRDQRRPRLLHPGLAAAASGAGQAEAGQLADRSEASGAAGCFGDIGTHAYNLGRFITGSASGPDFVQPEDLRAGPASWTITARPSFAIRTGPSAP